MGLLKFFKNIKFLYKNKLSDLNKKYFDLLFEQMLYECNSKNAFYPKILNDNDSVNLLINTQKSIIRYGDGEIAIMGGEGIPIQKYDKNLADRLKEIIKDENEKILIGINYHYYYPAISEYISEVAKFYRYSISGQRTVLTSLINPDITYGTTTFTQLYLLYKNYDFNAHYTKLRKIWDNKKITIICGDRVFNDIEYNIFDNASNVEYMHIPSKNAYSDYDNILANAKKIDKDRLLILIAGPTAKPLVYDLTIHGRRALDLGHIAKDYNAYKRGISIDAKAVKKFFAPD